MNIKNIQNFVWIFQKDRKNDGEIAEVYTDFVEDITCLINPQLYEGWYDPEEEYANQTIDGSTASRKCMFITIRERNRKRRDRR